MYIPIFLSLQNVVWPADQVRGGGGRHGGQDLHAHLLHHRQLPRGVRANCVSHFADPAATRAASVE